MIKFILFANSISNNYHETGGGRCFKIFSKNRTMVNSGNDDYKFYDKGNKLIKESKKEEKKGTINSMEPGIQSGAYHFENFVSAIRNGKPLNSSITEGNKSVFYVIRKYWPACKQNA